MTDIASKVDEWFLTTREERPSDGKLHPSSMSGCWRQAVYEAQGVAPTDEKEVRNYRIMWFGTTIHQLLQGALAGLPGFRDEVEVAPPGWPMTGSADAIYIIGEHTNYEDPGVEHDFELLEFKSISPFALKKKGLPQAHHQRQARMYMWGLNKQGISVTQARIVYVSRDDMAMQEYVIDRDEEWEEEFETELVVSKTIYLGEGRTMLPPRIPEGDDMDWLCRYCQFRTRCWTQDGDTERHDRE